MSTTAVRSASPSASATLRPARTSRPSPTSASARPLWTNGSDGIVFNEVNDQWRSYRARFHRLGTPTDQDITLYEETEELGFSVGVGKTQDKSLIVIGTGDNATSEVRFVSADDPTQPLTLVSPRKENRQYEVDAAHGKLWILTNDDHVNFRLAEADPANPGEWRTVIPGSDRVYLRHVTSYRDHLAIQQRVDGLDQLILRTYDGEERRIPVRGSELQRRLPRQSRVRAGRLSAGLFVAGHARDGLRLSPAGRPARSAEGPGDPVRLRRVEI